jgi:hypothetical protein
MAEPKHIPTEAALAVEQDKAMTKGFKEKFKGDKVSSSSSEKKKQKVAGYLGVDKSTLSFVKYLGAVNAVGGKIEDKDPKEYLPVNDYYTKYALEYMLKLNELIKATKSDDRATAYQARIFWKALQNEYDTHDALLIASKLADSKMEAMDKADGKALLSIMEAPNIGEVFKKGEWFK